MAIAVNQFLEADPLECPSLLAVIFRGKMSTYRNPLEEVTNLEHPPPLIVN